MFSVGLRSETVLTRGAPLQNLLCRGAAGPLSKGPTAAQFSYLQPGWGLAIGRRGISTEPAILHSFQLLERHERYPTQNEFHRWIVASHKEFERLHQLENETTLADVGPFEKWSQRENLARAKEDLSVITAFLALAMIEIDLERVRNVLKGIEVGVDGTRPPIVAWMAANAHALGGAAQLFSLLTQKMEQQPAAPVEPDVADDEPNQ